MKETTRAYLILAAILLFGSIANSAKAEQFADVTDIIHVPPSMVIFTINNIRIFAGCKTYSWSFPDKTDEIFEAQPDSIMSNWINTACTSEVI